MNSSHITRPYKHKDWLLWENTVFDFIGESDCDDTVGGFCITNKTVKECIEECKDGCAAGYQIQFSDGKSICVPIYTDLYPSLNPVYRLKRQSFYPQLNNTKVTSYINSSVFQFPPDSANAVFYRDILTLQNKNAKYSLSGENNKPSSESLIYMSDKNPLNIQIIPYNSVSSNLDKYKTVKFGDYIILTVPGTTLVLQQSVNYPSMVEWIITNDLSNDNDTITLRILPVNNRHKIGDTLSYKDSFLLQYMKSSVLALNKETKYIEIQYKNLDNLAITEENDMLFSFESKMTGYFCDNGVCKSIPINLIETEGVKGRYKGSIVTRNAKCWGRCSYKEPGLFELNSSEQQDKLSFLLNNKVGLFTVVVIITIVVLSIVFITILSRNNTNNSI